MLGIKKWFTFSSSVNEARMASTSVVGAMAKVRVSKRGKRSGIQTGQGSERVAVFLYQAWLGGACCRALSIVSFRDAPMWIRMPLLARNMCRGR